MKDSILISVVIPLYNKERHVFDCVNSVINQQYKNIEIIVVDDGSTDGGVDALKPISDNRLKIIRKTNGGVSSARNTGISQARGELITFLDADDVWHDYFLQEIISLYKKFPDCGLYTTSFERKKGRKVISKTPREYSLGFSGIINDRIKFSHTKEAAGGPLSVVVKKEKLDRVGYFCTELKMFEDIDLWFRLDLLFDTAFLNKVCATKHVDSDNNTSSIYDSLLFADQYILFASRMRKFIAQNNIKDSIKTKYLEDFISWSFRSLLKGLVKTGKFLEARIYEKRYNMSGNCILTKIIYGTPLNKIFILWVIFKRTRGGLAKL